MIYSPSIQLGVRTPLIPSLNEDSPAQFRLDFRTGRPTAIDFWDTCASQRAACAALNRKRAQGLLEAAQCTPPRQPLQADVWNAAFASESEKWDIPLISLASLGVALDDEGMLGSKQLRQLNSGAEAFPFADDEHKVVYKLFNLRANGSLGKKVAIEEVESGRFEIILHDATLQDTLEKLIVLNDAGGHPTEIMGLTDDGNFLVAKQPLAFAWVDFNKDKKVATSELYAVEPSFTCLNREIAVFWLRGESWIVCDLHTGNIMRTRDNKPTVIDALVGKLPESIIGRLRWAGEAHEDSQALRLGLPPVKRMKFGDGVNDDEL